MADNTAQQNMIVAAFNSETYVANRMDVQDTPIWDTVTFIANTTISITNSMLFTNVGSQSSKTPALTNMTQPQKLNAPEAFSIFGYSFRYSENISLLDIYNLLNGFCLQFYLGPKIFQQGPLWIYNAGGGIYGAAGAATTVLNNGMPGRSDMNQIAINVVIENQMSFFAQLNGNNYVTNLSGTGVTYQLVLRGLYARGVL
jgi:hypothetical protein